MTAIETPFIDPVPHLSGAADTAKPYGFLGLCLSLIGILILSTVFFVFAVLCGYALVFGWAHLADFFTTLASSAKTGDEAFLNFVQEDLTHADLDHSLALPFAISLIAYLALSLAILTFARLRGGRAWRQLIAWTPWPLSKAGRTYWLLAGGGVIGGLAIDVLVANFYPPSKNWFTVPMDDLTGAVLLFVLAAIFAPVAEELLFRGWIYTSLKASFGRWIAILASAVVFAAAHYEKTHIYALAVFPIGLILGGIREVTGSVKGSISFHAFYNTLAFGLAVLDIG